MNTAENAPPEPTSAELYPVNSITEEELVYRGDEAFGGERHFLFGANKFTPSMVGSLALQLNADFSDEWLAAHVEKIEADMPTIPDITRTRMNSMFAFARRRWAEKEGIRDEDAIATCVIDDPLPTSPSVVQYATAYRVGRETRRERREREEQECTSPKVSLSTILGRLAADAARHSNKPKS